MSDVITVLRKDDNTIQKIKSDRFNPEFHELIASENVSTMEVSVDELMDDLSHNPPINTGVTGSVETLTNDSTVGTLTNSSTDEKIPPDGLPVVKKKRGRPAKVPKESA